MEELKELIQYVSKQKVKQIEIITEDGSFRGKSKKLYDSIRNQDIDSDHEAMLLIYGEEDEVNYRKLKYRLKQKLINSVFFTDVNNYGRSAYEKSQVHLLKSYVACEILTLRGLNELSWTLAEKILNSAIKQDRLDIALTITKNLRRKFAFNNFNKSKYKRYTALTKSLLEVYTLELEVQEYFVILISHIANKNKIDTRETNKIQDRLDELDLVIKSLSNYHVRYYYHNALFYLAFIKNDVKQLNAICDEAMDYFSSRNDIPLIGQYSFILKKGVARLQNKDFEVAEEYIYKAINFRKTTTSAAVHQYRYNYLSLIQFLKGDYVSAYDSISIVINDKKFKKLKNNLQQNWYIKEAYLHFLIKAGRLDESQAKVKLKRTFRMKRFLNEVPSPSKDKTGYNLSIQLIQILFLILDKDHELIYNKLEALKQYGYRYLKGEKYIRSRTFIKMLQKLKNGHMDLDSVERKAQKYLEVLLAHPSDYSDETMQIEVIPYEKLWEELLYAL